ncbi:MAG: ATP-binding cassette domain-containing protein [Dehalococcoidia bacterium]|nr:ATP-binding cassette domain-containing protein [Dehalococcoidia bacterium]
MKMIRAEDLTKMFGHFVAVDHLSFTVEEGEIFGFLGPNGAGKTTTMMLLATGLNPTSGDAAVCGYDIVRERDEVRKNIAVVFEELSLDTNLTARENLDFHARMYHLDKESRRSKVAEALSLVGLRNKQDVLVRSYSGGMKRRLEIARAMLISPKVLFLDEPTLGVDVQTRRLLWNYTKRLNKESGTTVLLTTHYIEEADYLCDRLAILERGKIVVAGSPEELRGTVGDSLVILKLSRGIIENAAALFRSVPWVSRVEFSDSSLQLSVPHGQSRIPEIVKLAKGHGFSISSIRQRRPSLEDAFLHYSKKKRIT